MLVYIQISPLIMPATSPKRAETPKKGLRERIMDCLTSREDNPNTANKLHDEDKDNQECMDSYLRELTRTPLSKAWNNYRYKKWGQDPSLPPLEELEQRMLEITPSYCTLYVVSFLFEF